ncbi:MAG: BtpA/SgcQ family protein [Chloroherpetonaceae bacterium]|nr:BtpA/SgcQ family protein [Chthonomonadaceae bacterium]MDW8206306.1 BtpA/SgcQ family protein [Chloroherpetonaceae bacterium]
MATRIYGGLDTRFWQQRPLIGMVHLRPLPGSPLYAGEPMHAILEHAIADARALQEGGADAVMVENYFDVPFAKGSLPPHTVAALTRCVQAVREAVSLPVGVNALRNDAETAIAVAHVCGGQFVRINVYVGAAVTDQGIIEGAARAAVLYRKALNADVALWADIGVKHAAPLGTTRIESDARDAVERGLADALILTGDATGLPVNPEDIRRVRDVVPQTPLLVGSGLTPSSAAAMLACANGAIVGTWLKRDGAVHLPVDAHRVRALKAAMQSVHPVEAPW